MIRMTLRNVAPLCALAGVALLAACGEKAPPPQPLPPPPPPPPVVVIPPKPVAPNGASANLPVPPLLADGLRRSVNREISPAQTLWNLRAAYNVAALNCHAPKHAAILGGYKGFLTSHAKTLAATNRTVDAEWKKRYGAKFIPYRETYMTEVYNHYALPPVLPAFCDAVLAVVTDAAAVKSADLTTFAATNLPNIEIVYDDFYRRYETWRTEVAAWNALYAPPPPVVLPAPAPVSVVLPAAPPQVVVLPGASAPKQN